MAKPKAAVGEWRDDPTGRHQYRWYDGEQFTQRVADSDQQADDPLDALEGGGSERGVLISTMNDVPGYRVTRVLGECFGMTVRSRNAFSQAGSQFKASFGGELKGMTKNLETSRQQVLDRLCEHARTLGGNAVLAMRFDSSEMGDIYSEIVAYGTAVVIEPVVT